MTEVTFAFAGYDAFLSTAEKMCNEGWKVSINVGIDQAAFATSASCSAALIMS